MNAPVTIDTTAIHGCSCGVGLWLNIDGTWEHYVPEVMLTVATHRQYYQLKSAQGDDCCIADNPAPDYGTAVRGCVDCAGYWITFKDAATSHFQLADGVFVADDESDHLPF